MATEKPNYNEVKDKIESALPQLYQEQYDSIYEEERVKMKDFVIGALVGGIVGAAAGLLLAPKTGKDLRNDVAIQAVNLKDKSTELSKQLQEQSSQLVEKVKTLKSSKELTVFDDGTVSSEGEEPLDEIIDEVLDVESNDEIKKAEPTPI